LFAERGYEATKVTDICDSAGVAYGTFFNYFPAKRDVLRALTERARVELSEKLELLAKKALPLDAQLRRLFRGEPRRLDPRRRELVGQIWAIAATETREAGDRFHDAIAALLREGVARGQVRDDVPVDVLAELVGSTFSSMRLNWARADDYPVEQRAQQLARLVYETLAPRAAPTPARAGRKRRKPIQGAP